MGLSNPLHLAVLVLLVVLVFGARRLPELGRSLGGGFREFKGSLDGRHSEDAQRLEQPAAPAEHR